MSGELTYAILCCCRSNQFYSLPASQISAQNPEVPTTPKQLNPEKHTKNNKSNDSNNIVTQSLKIYLQK